MPRFAPTLPAGYPTSAPEAAAARIADYLVRRVAAQGTHHMFGVGGANIEDVYDAIARFGPAMTGVVAAQEFGAGTMADGYARSTNRIGVVLATSGGGALNLVPALGEAYDSRVPMLALIGQPPTSLEGRGAFQDTSGAAGTMDARTLFAQVSRFCAKATDPAQVPELLERALAAAADGPAVLLLPKDVQQAAAPGPIPATLPESETPDLRRAIELIRTVGGPSGAGGSGTAGRVVILAGPEVARADARAELEAFATALGAPVAVTPDGKDVFRNSHPLFAGVAGTMGHLGVQELIEAAQLCVVVGTPLPMTARGGLDAALAGTRVLHLGSQPPFVDVELTVPGPLGEVLWGLAAAAPPRPDPAPPPRLRHLDVPPASGPGVRYRDAVGAIAAHLPAGADVFADAGNTGAAVVHHLLVPDGGRFVVALGMGGMGYAFGAGIGSAMGRGRRTFVIAGDGAFYMHGLEVHTAVDLQLPVTFIVFNNNAHAMCVTREQLFYTGDYTFNRFVRAHLGEAVAAMFPHASARSADTLAGLERALAETASDPGTVFISVECDPDEVPPFAPFL